MRFSGGSLISGGWKSGLQDVAIDASDNVGIRRTRLLIGGMEYRDAERQCERTHRIPCRQGGDRYYFETSEIKLDGEHDLALEAIDSAGNPQRVSQRISIDNSAPGPAQGLTVNGGEGWRSRNRFSIAWTNPVQEGTAPIDGVGYELCPTTGPGLCTRGGRSGRDLSAIEDLEVPGEGEWLLRLWLRDQAGNAEPSSAPQPLRLRLDTSAPELGFDAQDSADPAALSVLASDTVSGVDKGEIEIRRRGQIAWRPLDTELAPRGFRARIDDESLSDGTYEVRARAFDHAANERSSGQRLDGTDAEVSLPLRVATRLRAGVARRAGRGSTRLASKAFVSQGRSATIAGRLLSTDSTPVAGVEVLVYRLGSDETSTPVATLRTSVTGRFSYRSGPGASRTLRIRYPGTRTVRGASADVQLRVRAKSSFRPSRRFLVNGETVRFSGGLTGRPVPSEGKLIEMQVYLRRRWRTFATTRTNARGRWLYDYRFDGTRGRVLYRFRARVPREASYPYETGVSRGVKVVVRGL